MSHFPSSRVFRATALATLLGTAFTVAALLSLFASSALAVDPVNKSFLRGVAIKGYDPVAYFEMGKPAEGKSNFTVEWKDATWRFTTAANRDKFKANPEQYAPQYGGYCAYAVSQGYTADISPDAWRLVDGKLYLNYDKNVQKLWEADVPGYIAKANANWPKIAGK